MDFMDFKELPSPPPIPAQVETGIPRASICLLSGCFYFFLFLLQHQKTGLGGALKEACPPNPLEESGLSGEPGDLLWSGTGIQPQGEARGRFGSGSAFRVPDSGSACVGLPSLHALTVPTCGLWEKLSANPWKGL